ncbi:TRAP transporter substrate-binding protein DctP [Marinomonas pollencensis]|uniref:TRAP-type C4-dicarboxylate transport system substrate-binding protein n=1 Tax=Marinomonas pollencensis TaxID=491954 RepID=A0A3E0DX72_9GAMM|nr:TRAP transporter substrate-binding protein DctP [Marinomonas pollencensis]REG86691.1 TRAP-type C4-dicarboxylate transport system substrate-binding protein [Marinomonas pollencensis]
MSTHIKKIVKIGLITLIAGSLSIQAASTLASTNFRLSHSAPPGSDRDIWAKEFAKQVKIQTEDRVTFRVYPANQLGDWEETYDQLSQGSIDAAVQSLSTKYDKRIGISWFPYSVSDYKSAEQAWNVGGFLFDVMNGLLQKQNLTLLAPYANGMGGMAVSSNVEQADNPNADHKNLKIRVWPSGAATHRPVLERLGYNTTTMPWAELYTGVQTGVIDGMIGGTPENAVRDWNGIVKTWVQLNDHFEVNWLVMNQYSMSRISENDRQTIQNIAKELATERFQQVAKSDESYRQELKDSGVTVITFNEQELASISDAVRKDVWPHIKDELGDDLYQLMVNHYNE